MRIAAAVLALIATACATAPRRDARFDGIRRKLQAAVEAKQLASISVAVAVDGRTVWEEALGYADVQRGIRATPETQYAIASITKPITATGVMVLAGRGLVDLSRPINDYLGADAIRGYADDASRATVRAVLQHRAGLAEQNRYYFPGEPRPPILDVVRDYGFIAWPANEKYRYSNIGYGALEALIEQVSGKPYAAFLRDEVFLPHGMTRSSVGPSPGAAVLHDAELRPIPHYDFASRGSGYVFSTPRDLVRFALVRDAGRARMLAERVSTGTATGRYGLDWWCGLGICGRDETEHGYAWHGHDGGMPGASARMKIVPSRGIVVVTLSNSRAQLTYDVADEILDLLVPEFAEKRKNDPSLKPAPPAPAALREQIAGTWRGEIITRGGTLPLTLSVDAAALRLKIGDQPECTLEETRFTGVTVEGGCRAALPLLPDIPARDYDVWLETDLRDGELRGTLSAYAPPPLYHFLLPAYVRLRPSVPSVK